MFALAFSFMVFAFIAYCAFSDSDERNKNFYMVLLVVVTLTTAINFVKVVS